MKKSVIIDTDILIDVGRNVDPALIHIEQLAVEHVLAISAVTQMELIVGCRNKDELRDLEKFLRHFEVIGIDKTISKEAVNLLRTYRLSHGLLIADALREFQNLKPSKPDVFSSEDRLYLGGLFSWNGLIAATAIGYACPLISKNQRDYRFGSSGIRRVQSCPPHLQPRNDAKKVCNPHKHAILGCF